MIRQSTVRQAQVRDPICLEEIDVDVGDWVENLRALDREDFGWINVALPITKVEYPTMYNAEGVSDSSINTNDGHEFAD
ncbi:hypothetical protein GIB67_035385 [Kingdonia uniflora]|uniref:Uncharacterized protein n=1 Tax=Kingdonia uniflora TaxID=39325 RepID=A0A7J7MMT4_9MAGN|nr:hypothetical protein GIB67_035385 [Kingdonia uniflora]